MEIDQKEIMDGWKDLIKNWSVIPFKLTVEERHQFEQMSLIHKQSEEKEFILKG